MNTRAAGRGTTTAGIAATTDAVTTVAAAGERGRQGTTRGVIYQPGSTLTKFGTFPENRTTSVSRSLTGSSTVPVHRKGGSRQRMSGPSTMSHPAMWTCPACGRPLTVALNPEGGEAGAHRPLEISRASAAAHACAPAARFPQFHNASSLSIIGYEPASCQPWQPPVSAGAGAEDDEGVISQSEYTLTKPSSCPNHRDHVTRPSCSSARQGFTVFGQCWSGRCCCCSGIRCCARLGCAAIVRTSVRDPDLDRLSGFALLLLREFDELLVRKPALEEELVNLLAVGDAPRVNVALREGIRRAGAPSSRASAGALQGTAPVASEVLFVTVVRARRLNFR